MAKASDARTLHEVAKEDADEKSEVNEFLHSPAWQERLENARKQREINLAARNQKGQDLLGFEPGDHNVDHASAREPPPRPISWLDRIAEARQQREVLLAQRTAESEKPAPAGTDGIRNDFSSGTVIGTAGRSIDARKQEPSSTGTSQTGHESLSPEQLQANIARDNESVECRSPPSGDRASDDTEKHPLGDQKNSELSARQFTQNAANSLQKKFLPRLIKPQRTPEIRLGSVAIGCVLGVIASSSIYFAYSERGVKGSLESAGLEAVGTELAQTVSSRDKDAVQPKESQSAVPVVVGDHAINFPNPPGASSTAKLVESGNSISLAAQTPPLPAVNEGAAGVEAKSLPPAPNVRSSVQAIEQPNMSTNVFKLSALNGAIPTFVWYPVRPEVFAAAVALSDEAATNPDINGFLVDASTLPPRPPDVSFRPASLSSPGLFVSGDEPRSLPEQVLAYQPEPRGRDNVAANPELSNIGAMAVYEPFEQPAEPSSIDPDAIGLRIASSNPLIQPEDLAPYSQNPRPRNLAPRSRPLDSSVTAALIEAGVEPADAVTPTGGAEFRLFAPNKLSEDVVDSVVANLLATGHELGDSARVGFDITRSNVRFYHSQDEAKATALARDADALLRDFTGSNSKTQIGVVELWLAGESSGTPSAKAKTTRSSGNAADNPINQLRSQVLKKLRSVANE